MTNRLIRTYAFTEVYNSDTQDWVSCNEWTNDPDPLPIATYYNKFTSSTVSLRNVMKSVELPTDLDKKLTDYINNGLAGEVIDKVFILDAKGFNKVYLNILLKKEDKKQEKNITSLIKSIQHHALAPLNNLKFSENPIFTKHRVIILQNKVRKV